MTATPFILQVTSSEQAINATANTVSSANLVRVVNQHATGLALLTVFVGGNSSVNNSITILPSSETWVRKEATDTLVSNSSSVVGAKIKRWN